MTIRDFFNNKKITLTLTTLDDESFAVFTDSDIIKDSIKFEGKLMNGLNPSSSVVTLSVISWTDKLNSAIAYAGELKATLKADDIVVFKGYYSNKVSMNVYNHNMSADTVQITIEDIGTRLFKKELFPDSLTDYYFSGTLHQFVALIKSQLSNAFDYSTSLIEDDTRVVSHTVESGDTIETLLKQLCLELGYVYYWKSGILTFFKIPTSSDAEGLIRYQELAVNGNTAIQISKAIRKYKTSRIQCDTYENANGILVYRDNSGTSDNSGCEVTVEAGQHYPPLSDTNEPAQYDCEDLESGKELINVDNLVPVVEFSGYRDVEPEITIKKSGATSITVDFYNKGSTTLKLTKLECKADVVRLKSTEVVKSTIGVTGSESDNVYKTDCEWIHSKDDAETLAKTVCAFYGYCDTQYLFYMLDNLEYSSVSPFDFGTNNYVGKVMNLVPIGDIHILISNATIDLSTNYIKYQGYGYNNMKLDVSTISSNTQKQDTSRDGSIGEDGNGIDSIVNYFLATSEGSGVTTKTEGWTPTVQTITSINRYLWNYYVTNYTKIASTTSTPVIIGVYGDKGDPGRQGDPGEVQTCITRIEYALSTNDSLTTEQQQALTDWVDESVIDWSYGYYIYKRTKTVVIETSEVSYTYNGRDTVLEDFYSSKLAFDIIADRYTYPIDSREYDSSASTTITVTIKDSFYEPDSYTWALNNISITPTDLGDNKYSFTLPIKNGLSSYVLDLQASKNDGVILTRSLIFTADDRTTQSKFFGAVDSLSNVGAGEILLDGDGCFLTQDDGNNAGNLVYVYEDGVWYEFNESAVDLDKKTAILAKAQEVALQYANTEGVLSASYAYLGTLISNYISAKQVGAETIILTGDKGKMVGGDYTTLDGEFLANKGLYLDSEGTARFNDAKLRNCTIDSGEIRNITITGIVDNDALTTTLTDSVGTKISMGSIDTSTKAYVGSQAKAYIKSLLSTKNKPYVYSGTVNGTSYSQIIDTTTANSLIQKVNLSETNVNLSGMTCVSIYPATDTLIFARFKDSSYSYLYKSTNGGASWSRVTNTLNTYKTNNTQLSLSYSKGQDLWVGIAKQMVSGNNYFMVTTIEDTVYSYYSKDPSRYLPIDIVYIYFNADGELMDYDHNYIGLGSTFEGQSCVAYERSWPNVINPVDTSSKGDWSSWVQYPMVYCWEFYNGSTYTIDVKVEIQGMLREGEAFYENTNYTNSHLTLTPSSKMTLPWTCASYNGGLLTFALPDSSDGSYYTFATPSGTWTKVTGSWSNSSSKYVKLCNTRDADSTVWAVVGPRSGITTRQLYCSTDATNWTYVGSFTTDEYSLPVWSKNRYFIYNQCFFKNDAGWQTLSSGVTMSGPTRCSNMSSTPYVYSQNGTAYRYTPNATYFSTGLSFLDNKWNVVATPSSVTDSVTTNTLTMKNGSEYLVNLPSTIPSTMDTYRNIPTVFSSTQTLLSLNSASITGYTRWNTSTNTEVTVPSYSGIPSIVNISPSSFKINGTEYANSTWWIKNTTSVTGYVIPNNTTKGVTTGDINPKIASASIGNATAFNSIRGNTLYGTLGNDLADCIPVNEEAEIEAGYCYCFDGEKYYKSTQYLEKGIIGIQSDTYGIHIGSDDNIKQLDVAVSGFVLAYVDKDYPTGTPLTCGPNGILTEISEEDKIRYPERIVATYWKKEPLSTWKDITVNNRKWIKIK